MNLNRHEMSAAHSLKDKASGDAAMLVVFERLALDAGSAIMRIFHEGCAVDAKADASPVTEADR